MPLQQTAEYFFMKEYKKQVLPKIGKNQFAYQRCLGTVVALVYSLEKWTRMLDQKDTAAVNVIFKDFSKAFNCMQPSILVQRPNSMNVTSNITKLCMNFLSDRKQCTRVNSKMTDYLPVEVGVPQGTLSSPLFWLAFIDSYDIPASAIQTIKYVDDISCSWLTEKSSVKKDRI